MSRHPFQDRGRVAHGGGESYALDLATEHLSEPFDDRDQMGSPIIAGEGVNFVDDRHAHSGQQQLGFLPARNHHHLQRLRRGHQASRSLAFDGSARAGSDDRS